MVVWACVCSIGVLFSVAGVCGGLLVVKKEKRIPMVRTNAENIDKKDKESLNALSDTIPPP